MNKIVKSLKFNLQDLLYSKQLNSEKASNFLWFGLILALIINIMYLTTFYPIIVYGIVCLNLGILLVLIHAYLVKNSNLTFSINPINNPGTIEDATNNNISNNINIPITIQKVNIKATKVWYLQLLQEFAASILKYNRFTPNAIKLSNSSSSSSNDRCLFRNINNKININLVAKLKLFFKITLLQLQIWFFSSWLRINILAQHKLNPKLSGLDFNITLNENVTIIINNFVTWLILFSGLLILGIYKYPLQNTNITLAKCLNLKLNNTIKTSIHNTVLAIELYLRTAIMYLFAIVLIVNFFEQYSTKYQFKSLLASPWITSFFIVLFLTYLQPLNKKIISFLVKKTNLNFVKINAITISSFSLILFILIQLSLYHLEKLNLLKNFGLSNSIAGLVKLKLINNFTSLVMLASINIVLTFSLITDVTIKYLENFKLKTVYISSLWFPIAFTIFNIIFKFSKNSNVFFCSIQANILVFILSIIVFNQHYNKVHHLFCSFNLKLIKDKPAQQLRQTFENMLLKLINLFALNLNFYYVFGGFFVITFLSAGILTGLPVIVILLLKQFNNTITNKL